MADQSRKIHIVICGPGGRMGSTILKLAGEDKNIQITGLLSHNDSKVPDYPSVSKLSDLSAASRPVVIDFTAPESTDSIATQAADLGWPLLVGTTGLSDANFNLLRQQSTRIPVLQAYNTSLGITLLSHLVKQAAAQLSGYDIEIVETHHRLKKDAPSGTAILLANSAAAGRDIRLNDHAIYGRQGMTGVREDSQIGIHAIRGGDVAGDHNVIFAGPGERLELGHRATTRETFAAGALKAAQFLANAPAGYYSMKDVLGIS